MEERWDTALETEKGDSDEIVWCEIPRKKIDEIKRRKIPRHEWQAWATDFLIFASEFNRRVLTNRGRKGRTCQGSSAKEENPGPLSG